MNKFKDAALKVLQDAKRPLSSAEITSFAIKGGLLKSKGQTPERSMNAQLNIDVKLKGTASAFIKTGRSTFALNEPVKEQ